MLPAIRLLCRIRMFLLPGFDACRVDDKDIETQKVQVSAVARGALSTKKLHQGLKMKQYNCQREGALLHLLNPICCALFQCFSDVSQAFFMQRKLALVVRSVRRFVLWAI